MFISCNIINPADPVPSYLKIDGVTLNTTNATEGSNSNKIVDAWAYAGGQDLGVYNLPALFPVLASGPTQIIISPGIEDNGIAASRTIYPFYFPDTQTIDLQPKIIYPLHPVFKYRPGTVFSFIEDFESGNIFNRIDGDTTLTRIVSSPDIFEGAGCGKIFLDSLHTYTEVETANAYIISTNVTNPIYLELNYKCTQPFQVGIMAHKGTEFIRYYNWTINPKAEWNKIYLNMTDDIRQLAADDYRILIKATYDVTVKPDAGIFFDNIKLVHQ